MKPEGRTKKWLAVAALGLMGIVLGMSLQTGACFDEDCTAQPAWWRSFRRSPSLPIRFIVPLLIARDALPFTRRQVDLSQRSDP